MTTPLFLYLVRHGESEWNAEHRLTGWSDVPLTARGRAQAASLKPLISEIAIDDIWSSDLLRAADTARIAAGEPRTDRRLREIFFGDLEGVVWSDMDKAHKSRLLDFESFKAPGGESTAEFRERVLSFVDELQEGNHFLFVHGGVVRILLAELGDATFVPNCTFIGINWTAQQLLFIKEPPSEAS